MVLVISVWEMTVLTEGTTGEHIKTKVTSGFLSFSLSVFFRLHGCDFSGAMKKLLQDIRCKHMYFYFNENLILNRTSEYSNKARLNSDPDEHFYSLSNCI